jgi:polyphenol oxidase
MPFSSAQQGLIPIKDIVYFDMQPFGDNENGPVFHGFFGRQGGVSKDVYNALNCGRGSGDIAENVKANLKAVAEKIGVMPDHLLTLHQVHGKECAIVKNVWDVENRPQADAAVTDQKGIALGILTADCAPVLFHGQKADGKPVIGAAHAGWKGAIGGALDATLDAMEGLGAVKDSIKACIGPCIAQVSYEVREDFYAPFEAEDPSNERFFMAARREGHLMFDLAGYCAARLAKAGLKKVYIKDLDTYFNEEDFFSYRRATHRAEKDYGRQISLIFIK